MELIAQNVQDITFPHDGRNIKEVEEELLMHLEMVGRTAAESWHRAGDGTAEAFVRDRILKTGHTSILEMVRVNVNMDFMTTLPTHACTRMVQDIATGLKLKNFLGAPDGGVTVNVIDSSKRLSEDNKYNHLRVHFNANLRWLWHLLTERYRELEANLEELEEYGNDWIAERTANQLAILRHVGRILGMHIPSIFDDPLHDAFSGTIEPADVPDVQWDHRVGLCLCDSEVRCDGSYRTFLLTTGRDVTHEAVRHRSLSFNQSSQRAIDVLKKNNFAVIDPRDSFEWSEDDEKYRRWYEHMQACENAYRELQQMGIKSQEARLVLPNSTATKLVISGTLPMWQRFLELRLGPNVYPPMRKIAQMIRDHLHPPVSMDEETGE